MISRRRFLQALLSIPAVAALPAMALAPAIVETLPEQEAPTVNAGGSWLRLNGRPVDCVSWSIGGELQYIDVTSIYDPPIQHFVPGLLHHSLEARILGDLEFLNSAFRSQDPLTIEAAFGDRFVVRATGYIRQIDTSLQPGNDVVTNLSALLTNVEARQ